MGSGGGGSGLSAGKGGRFSLPQFNAGSEKQKGWAGRILKGFDEAFDKGISDFKEHARSEIDFAKSHGESVEGMKKSERNFYDAVAEGRKIFRQSIQDPAYKNAVTVIENREQLQHQLERMMMSLFKRRGFPPNTHTYVPFKISK